MKIYNPLVITGAIDNSRIQDTRHAIDPSINKKPVSDETCRTYLSVGSRLQSKISNLKSRNRLTAFGAEL
ncbi:MULTISPECIES: hypothetical protein [unclassified Microcoleus]|uniref:hypothetical protein n=1 Tax=unclassified Microcoleus TaxID=2642155 RepID=UPI002FD669BD